MPVTTEHNPAIPGRYHHGDLRAALIAAAERLLVDQNSWDFTLREVARAAGVSHNAPYNHFLDKRALLDVVATRAFAALNEALAQCTAAVAVPDKAAHIEAAAVGYVLFAFDQPARFRLMFSAELAETPSAALRAATAAAFDMLDAAIATGIGNGAFRPDPAGTHALAAWSLVHGLGSLILDKRAAVDADRTAVAELARTIAGALLAGISSEDMRSRHLNADPTGLC